MIQTLTETVLAITGFQLLVLALVLLSQDSPRALNRNLLVAFLLTKAFLITRWLSFHFGLLQYQESPYLYHLSGTAFFLLAPLLYLYIRSLCYRDFRLTPRVLTHLVPFALLVIYNILSVSVLLSSAAKEQSFLYPVLITYHSNVFWTVNLIQILAYIVAMLTTVRAYRRAVREVYSSGDTVSMDWLVALIVVISLHWMFVTSRAMLSALDVETGVLTALIDLFSITIFLVFTTILVIRGLHQLRLFAGIDQKTKYATSRLDDTDIHTHAEALRDLMEAKKPYLEPSLTLEDLARELSLQSWDLSRVINDHFHQNFFNFVNSYRIQEALRLFADSEGCRMTVLEVAYEVGFNSKSAFNNAFRKHTGRTPTELRKSRGRPAVSPPGAVLPVLPYKNRPAL